MAGWRCWPSKVTRGSGVRTPRTGGVTGDGAAKGGLPGELRGFKRQHLIMFGEQEFDVLNTSATTRGDHQFGRFIINDAGMRTDINRFAHRLPTIKRFTVAAVNTQGRSCSDGGVDVLLQYATDVVINHIATGSQKRSSSGNGSLP